MRLARITGRVSATIKTGKLAGLKMLVADYVDPEGETLERAVVITDACGAGPGDLVLVAHGSAARIPTETAGAPTDATAVAFIDQLSVGGRDVALTPTGPPVPIETSRRPRSNRRRRSRGSTIEEPSE